MKTIKSWFKTTYLGMKHRNIWIAFLSLSIYALIFPFLYTLAHRSSIGFYILPVIVISLAAGKWWGLASGLLFAPLHLALFNWIEAPFSPFSASSPFFWMTYFILIIISYTVSELQNNRRYFILQLSQRQQIEEALQQSEQKYRSLLDHTSNIIVLFDQNGTIEYATPSAEKLTGYTQQELNGKHFTELIHPDWRIKTSLFYARQIKTKTQETFNEFPIVAKSGQVRWVAQVLELLFDEDEVTGGQGVLMDVSSRIQAQKALKESEQNFRTLFNQSNDAVLIHDLDGILLEVNRRAAEMLGYQLDELVGTDLRTLLSEEESHRLAGNLILLREGAHIPVFERQLKKKDGSYVPVEINTALVRNSDGQPEKALGVVRDISERKKNEEKLRFLATHDPLTKLPNRTHFNEHLKAASARAIRKNSMLAVAFIDLDNFKEVNDQYGHDIGDLVLQIISRRIQNTLRKSDLVARMGGDEFIILVEDIQEAENAGILFQKIRKKISEPIQIEKNTLMVYPSIGISLFPRDDPDPKKILQLADIAMYAAKRQHSAPFVFYHELEIPTKDQPAYDSLD